MKACPMNIRLQAPVPRMSIGIGAELGFMLVPDAMFMRYMPASFMDDICANDRNGIKMPASGSRLYMIFSCDSEWPVGRDNAPGLDSQDEEEGGSAIDGCRRRMRLKMRLPFGRGGFG